MLIDREYKQTIRMAGPVAKTVIEVLGRYETETMFALPQLAMTATTIPLQFFSFSCLGTKKGREELNLSLRETYFWKFGRHKIAEDLLQSLADKEIKAKIIIILPDKEPVRTWGWSVQQNDISDICQMMIEDEEQNLPEHWKVMLWSDIESAVPNFTYKDALVWAKSSAHPLVVKEEAEHLSRFPDISIKRKDAALRQIAAYAQEGYILEQFMPRGILIQSEFPIKRKDRMYQPLRNQPLPIIHPYPERR